MKIIYILAHTPPDFILKKAEKERLANLVLENRYIKTQNDDYVYFFLRDFHVMHAEKFKKLYPKFDIEAWRPYENLHSDYELVLNGIKHRLFPVKKYLRWFSYSRLMVSAIKKLSKKEKVALHFYEGHSLFVTLLILKLRKLKNVVFIKTQGSNSFPLVKFKQLSIKKKLFRLQLLLFHYLELKSLKYVHEYFVGSKTEIDYISKKIKWFQKASLIQYGCRFSEFIPIQEKESLKIKLGIEENKKVIIYVGRFYEAVELPIIFNAFKEICKERDDIVMIAIGGYKNEAHYQHGIDCGVQMIERTNKDQLYKYYQVADLNVYPVMNEYFVNNAGLGGANIEAMALNIPLLSNNIKHFPGSIEERKQIGCEIGDGSDIKDKILYMLDNKNQFSRVREISINYLDENIFFKKYFNSYSKLS